MKYGHVQGTRNVPRAQQAWFDSIQAELLARIEAAIAAQQQRQAEASAASAAQTAVEGAA